MSVVEPGSFLTLHYRLAGPQGDVVNTFGGKPATLSLGAGELSPVLEQRLVGLAEGARAAFDSAAAVKDYLQLHLAARPHEVFAVLFLDAQHKLIALEELFRGTLTQTSVYPREVALRALHHHAAAVILAHNHPSGGVQPSRADEAITQQLKSALALIDVRVLDHVIVAPGQALSMAEKGLI